MTDKELKKLSRADLLELLLIQTKETELLRQKLEAAEKALEQRQIRMTELGSLAEAMVEVNGVMAAAQAAAEQYLENIKAMEQETKSRCAEMIQVAWDEAQEILKNAQQQRMNQR